MWFVWVCVYIYIFPSRFLSQGASSLLDMISYYESTAYLDLSDNTHVGTSAWRALAHLIKQVGELGVLHLLHLLLLWWTFNNLSFPLLHGAGLH